MIKEMIYSASMLNPPEMLIEGEYKGFNYYVLNFGTHPCAYIDVTDTIFDGIDYNVIDIDCHGGLTYGAESLHTVNKKGWFIGWDYAHYCDFSGIYINAPHMESFGKKWTTNEIVRECEEVIDKIILDIKARKMIFKLTSFSNEQ